MKNDSDNNYISVGSWMFMMFITAIPIIGWIMILIWAFAGDNQSRKNYYRAILAWMLVFVGLIVALALMGSLPAIKNKFSTRSSHSLKIEHTGPRMNAGI